MPATITIAIDKLDAQLIRELKEKYQGTELEITIRRQEEGVLLSEQEFWSLIDLLDWEQDTDDAITKPLVEALSNLPVSKIYGFEEQLAEKLYALDKEEIAQQFPSYPSRFSVDGFLYDRLCVVANGKAVYEAVLEDPTRMPTEVSFEPLLYVASQAYELKTGNTFDYQPTVNYETYSNKEGWNRSNK